MDPHSLPHDPVHLLKQGLDSFSACLGEDGELRDPLFHVPTQYGTAYHAYANAVAATVSLGQERFERLAKAHRGLEASLRGVQPQAETTVAGFNRADGSLKRLNHRDFFWPPILKTFQIMQSCFKEEAESQSQEFRGGKLQLAKFQRQIQETDILQSFRSRPPSNWSAVWLSGEWLRVRLGLSPYDIDQIDRWLSVFFESHIEVDKGFYHEPGHSNSYDLFTRFHLADMLAEGYNGSLGNDMEQLLLSGLKRSLSVQLSDGSLASAHRSTGQTWTIGAQCAYFVTAACLLEERPHICSNSSERTALIQQAHRAAARALSSFARWQRRESWYSPVENRLPPEYRVGYEGYTADGHYSNLALAFLATAVMRGIQAQHADGSMGKVSDRPVCHIENDPVYRAVAHNGPYSVHVNARPARDYDTFGIVDVTFGTNRLFHFVSSVRHMESGRLFNIGCGLREDAEPGPCDVLGDHDYALIGGIHLLEGRVGFRLEGRANGRPDTYCIEAAVESNGVHIRESTPGRTAYWTLFIPYLRKAGDGPVTRLDETNVEDGTLVFIHGRERVRVTWKGEVERLLVLPYGYENRRGLCGLVRVDFKDLRQSLDYLIATDDDSADSG